MPGITNAINNALSGLNVSQSALAILSQNIANANTPGYSRQILNLETNVVAGVGQGVRIGDITRRIDKYLQGAVLSQSTLASNSATLNDVNSRIQLLLGQPGSQNSITSYLTGFFKSLNDLALTPTDPAQKTLVINATATLTNTISTLAASLQELRFQSDHDISDAVIAINSNLRDIFELNASINSQQQNGQSVTALLDQRDQRLTELAQYMDIRTTPGANGTITVSTGNGISLLDDNLHQLTYSSAASSGTFINGATLSAIQVQKYSEDGTAIGSPFTLVSQAASGQATTSLISGGKLGALLQMRDTNLPNILAQLDAMAAGLRDRMNAAHNAGSGYPGVNSYTGTRSVLGRDINQWGGSMRLALLDNAGQPIPSPYAGEGGLVPMNFNLGAFNSGNGAGRLSTQDIINEINQFYGPPGNKVNLGNLNDIRLASNVAGLPGVPPQLKLDFDLANISGTDSRFFVTGMRVRDSNAVDITSLTSNVPKIGITDFQTVAGSSTVAVHTASTTGLIVGQQVLLSDPGMGADTIPQGDLTGFVTITKVTANGFEFTAGHPATNNSTTPVSVPTTVTPPYATAASGGNTRTNANGVITADLTGHTTDPFYTVEVDVAVDDGSGKPPQISTVTYQVPSQSSNMMNMRYSAQSADGDATLKQPTSTLPLAVATMVDANGNELPKVAGQYITTQRGFLKIKAYNSNYTVAIDSLDSAELGQFSNNPPLDATNRGFSHYFGLNDFFDAGDPGSATDTLTNSALNLRIAQRLVGNPNLISLGTLALSTQPSDPAAPPNYTYVRGASDNSIIQRMANIVTAAVDFPAAGGLGASSQTLGAYTGQIIGLAAVNAESSESKARNDQLLFDNYQTQSSSLSGVNLDQELAFTVIIQNAYTASARVISVASQLFAALLEAV